MSTITTNTLAARDESGKMVRHIIQRRAVGPADVHIKIKYSGICHSDIHTAKGEWGKKSYPLCVGHEIVGEVVAVGAEVTKFAVGDIAGIGCFTDSCRNCDECKEGTEQYCSGKGGMHGTYGSMRPEALHPGGMSHGGYSSDIVVDQNYVISIPDSLNVPESAPLLCAGITCYSPFQHYGLKAGMKLGVVGLGGLGHMAVKIGAAMGAEVTVLSRSANKKETALEMGATNFIVSTDDEQMKAAAKSLHMIYDSVAAPHSVKTLLKLLRSSGKIIMVGGVPNNIDVSAFDLLPRRISVVGSCIGGIKETQEMINFCAEHKILPMCEIIEATPEAVDAAWQRAINSDVKYRFVIKTGETLEAPSDAEAKANTEFQASRTAAANAPAKKENGLSKGFFLLGAVAAVGLGAFLFNKKRN